MNPPRKLIRLLLLTRNLRLAVYAWRLGIPWLHLERQGKKVVLKGTDILCEDLPSLLPHGLSRADLLHPAFGLHAGRLASFGFSLQIVGQQGKNVILLNTGEVKLRLDGLDALSIAEEVFGRQEYGVRISNDSILIDVGMNVGTTALYFAKEPAVKRVVAFEPSLSAIERAERNFAINPDIAKKIEVRPYALGDTNGRAYLRLAPEWPPSSKIVQSANSETLDPNDVLVEIRDAETELQSLLAETTVQQQIILKMDCEGSEREIFRRFSANTLSRIHVILLEWHSQEILGEIGQKLEKSAFSPLVRRPKKDIGMLYAFCQQS